VWLKLSLARGAKNNKKGFYGYVSQKSKVKESVPPLENKNGDPVSTDEEKAEVLKNHKIIESFRLEKTSNIIKSNRQPKTTMPAQPCPECNLYMFFEHLQEW